MNDRSHEVCWTWLCRVTAALAYLLIQHPAWSAELRLRPQAATERPVVCLGDVADVISTDDALRQQLGALELFAAPAAGTRRYVRAREVVDALLLAGVNLVEHRISGASHIEVVGTMPAAAPLPAARQPLSASVRSQAESAAARAIERWLRDNVAADRTWRVAVTLDEPAARQLSLPGAAPTVVDGATMPGQQTFTLAVATPEGALQLPVSAQVSLPPGVVVATRSIPRGAIVQATDVALQYDALVTGQVVACQRLEDVVGRETTRALAAGQVLDAAALRSPVMVRRGDAVTVYARTAGLRVRTTGRAREEGGLGDVVVVENLLNRESFFARVTGLQEVEVYARAMQATAGSEVWQPGDSPTGVVR